MTRQIIDATGPTNWNATPEGRKLRARILGGINAALSRNTGPLEYRPRSVLDRYAKALDRYAKALGLTPDAARKRIEAQEVALAKAAMPHNQPTQEPPPRRLTNATGPTSWDATPEGRRLRASILRAIDARLYAGAPSPAHLWSNAPMSAGNRPSRTAPEW